MKTQRLMVFLRGEYRLLAGPSHLALQSAPPRDRHPFEIVDPTRRVRPASKTHLSKLRFKLHGEHTKMLMNRVFATLAAVFCWTAHADAQGPLFAPAPAIVGGPESGEVFLLDLNHDGHLDLITKHLLRQRLAVWSGDGKGHFVPASESSMDFDVMPGAVCQSSRPARDRKAKASTYVEEACARRDWFVSDLKQDYRLDCLRSDSRFQWR